MTHAHHARRSTSMRQRIAVIAAVFALATGVVTVLNPAGQQASAATSSSLWLGTLGTVPTHAAQESRAGVKVAMMEINWRAWEPGSNSYSKVYQSALKLRLRQLQAAGMRVTLGLGLHFTPSWVFKVANSRLVDQYGNKSGGANFIFNQNLRNIANAYINNVNSVLGLKNFWAVRITSGERSELLYPDNGHYWAFDPNAKNGPALPSTMARNPLTSFKPGTGSNSFTTVKSWAQWYIGALADTAKWQINFIKAKGFTGYFQLVTPGVGVYARKFDSWVTSKMPAGAFGVGAVWATLYGSFKNNKNVVAYVSSVAEKGGSAQNCATSDASQTIDGANTVWWGSTRWISFVADKNGLLKAGENEGYSKARSYYYANKGSGGMMSTAIAQAKSCKFQGLYWAHDDQFWNKTVAFARFAKNTTTKAVMPKVAKR